MYIAQVLPWPQIKSVQVSNTFAIKKNGKWLS
jgi:hypothetical protein